MLRWIAAALAALLVLALAAAVAVPYVVDVPRVQSLIARSAAQALGRPVRLAALSVRVLPLPAVRLTAPGRDLVYAGGNPTTDRHGCGPEVGIAPMVSMIDCVPGMKTGCSFSETNQFSI